ncbi:MAG: SDR family NAD(P)-dependent oxidoreductase [Bacillota bacterium]
MTQPLASSTVLITGASSGIGLELARTFARHGHNLVLIVRNGRQLARLATELRARHHITVEVLAQDLSAAGSADELVAQLQQRSISIDILVNNAGIAIQGPFSQSNLDSQLTLLQLNIVALTHLTHRLLPYMLRQRFGRILNIASIAAYFPGPLTATYNASKAYVLSFSEALANELQSTGVTVTALCPGPTRTNFAARAGLSSCKAFRRRTMHPASVARVGYDALMAGKRVVVPGFMNKLRMLPIHLLPRTLLARFSRKYHETRATRSPSSMPPHRSHTGSTTFPATSRNSAVAAPTRSPSDSPGCKPK